MPIFMKILAHGDFGAVRGGLGGGGEARRVFLLEKCLESQLA